MTEIETLNRKLRQLAVFAERSSGLEARPREQASRNDGELTVEVEAVLSLFPTRISALNRELIDCLADLAGIGKVPPEILLPCLFHPNGELVLVQRELEFQRSPYGKPRPHGGAWESHTARGGGLPIEQQESVV